MRLVRSGFVRGIRRRWAAINFCGTFWRLVCAERRQVDGLEERDSSFEIDQAIC